LGPILNRQPKARLYKIEHPVRHNWLTHDPRAASVVAPSGAWYDRAVDLRGRIRRSPGAEEVIECGGESS
jgi:hypothetical protein